MKGKDYGHGHADDSKFGMQIIGAAIPILDLLSIGELGTELRTVKTDDGNEHLVGDTDAFDVTVTRYPTDKAQNAYWQQWLLACENNAVDAYRSANVFKYGPGETIVEAHFIGDVFIKRFKPSGTNRQNGGKSIETWTLSVHHCRKVQ